MSPEQVRGLPVDHRSDIFSFGAVLYELLSGRKAFDKTTASDTIAAILKEEPPPLTRRDVSPALDHGVHHCLEKDRDHRFQSARDVAFALAQASSAPVASVPAVGPRLPRSSLVPVAAAVLLVAVAGIAFFILRRSPAAPAGRPAVQRLATRHPVP